MKKKENNRQYMIVVDHSWLKLRKQLIKQGYQDLVDSNNPRAITIDNQKKWFYNVPAIFIYWKYKMNRKHPLKPLTSQDIVNNFVKLIVEVDNAFYNNLLPGESL